jgi:hypothetical protein
MRPEVSFLLGFASLVIPLAFIFALRRPSEQTRMDRSIRTIAGAAVTLLFFLAAPWSFLSYYLRFVLLAVFVWFAISELVRLRRSTGQLRQAASRLAVLSIALTGALAGYLSVSLVQGFFYPPPGVEVQFPLRSGTYVVLQGGSSRILNPFHHADPAGHFAVDVAKLNGWGARSRRIVPGNLADYEIFDQVVYSPCDGEVLASRDNLPDNPPAVADTDNPEGNHVILQCGDASILLAHMKHRSVIPEPHAHVAAGQPLGRVGNSGNSSEPHLHIQVTDGRPLLFDGMFPVTNRIIRR